MMQAWIGNLTNYVTHFSDNPWLLLGILFAVAALNLFLPPVPLESITVLLGYLSGLGHGSLWILIAATTGGMTASSLLLYYLTRRFGEAIVFKTPLKKLISQATYQRSIAWFEKYGICALFIGKLIPGMSFCSVLCSGLLHLSPLRSGSAFFGSNLLFFGSLALLGRFFGEEWENIIGLWKHFSAWGKLLVIISGGIVIGYLIFRRFQRKLPDV